VRCTRRQGVAAAAAAARFCTKLTLLCDLTPMAADHAQRMSNDSASWALIGVLTAIVAALELASPLAIAVGGFASIALACAGLGSVAAFYRRIRVNERFSACCIGLLQALVFSVVGSILSYLLARDSGAIWDPILAHWDHELGLDWLAYARLIDHHSWAIPPLRLAYASLIPQTIALILALGFSGRLGQLRTFILAAIISGSAAVLASPLFPAVGNFAYLGLEPGDFAHVWQASGLADVRDFIAVRSGSMTVLDLRTMQGIIVFPSYHGALATVTLWGFWKSGMKWLRRAGTAIALTTIVATPIEGGHYFIDVIAGIALAMASIAVARRLVFVRVPLMPLRALPFRRSRAAFAR
jgi:PAP2 superfamily protein